MPEAVPLLEKDERLTVMKGEGSNYAYLGFNLRDPILSKRRVREAIAHGLNIDEMITYLVGGCALRASGLLYPGNWAYEPGVEHYDYDLDRAARLLDEAGFTNRPARFRLSYKTSQNDVALRKAQYVQAQLKKLNIEVEIRSYEWSTFFADIRRGDFQLYSLEWVSITDPDIYYYIFHSKSVPPDGANRGGYSNPEVDRLLEIGRRETDRSKRAEIYRRVQKIVAHDLPYVNRRTEQIAAATPVPRWTGCSNSEGVRRTGQNVLRSTAGCRK
jgi:peptide/nickel transport system substrate-binding protein